MNFQEAIDQILLSPGPLCYQSLNDLFETAINTSPQALFKSLDLYYLGKKFDSLEDLLLISLFYKTYINLNKQLKTSYYSFDYEIYSINKILKERLISLFETKKLKNACFCSVLKQKEPRPKNFSEIIIQAQINIKLLSEYLFQPFFKSEDGLGFGLGFLGRIFLSWGLILEVSFDKEGLLLIIDLMKMSINPRLYRASSFLWGLDYAKLWVLLKVILKSQTIESLDCVNFNPKMNSQVFFEVFQEEGIKKYVRECWELLKGFTLKKEEVFLNGWKSILEVACTKKTLIFFLEISKALKKAKEIKLLWRFNEELVLNGLLGKLKGVFFFEVLEILKLYLFGNFFYCFFSFF